MNELAAQFQHITVDLDGADQVLRIEYRWIQAELSHQPIMVFLHEGLGSTSMWKDWPDQICAALGCRGLVFSRPGYGKSSALYKEPHWPLEFMHIQAKTILPAFFAALNIQDQPLVLYGHSDGGSIALLYAAYYPQQPLALIVAAPHIFVEELSLSSIRKAREVWLETDMPQRLGRYHDDVEGVFWGWNNIWLHPDFESWNITALLKQIECPVLALQGEQDEYGTLAQVTEIKTYAPQTQNVVIPNCGHSPHRDQPNALQAAVEPFFKTISKA